MADYITIKGYTVQNRTADTKATGVAGASWSSGGDLNRGLAAEIQGAGASNTAAIATGGQTGGPPYVIQAKTEQYNGTAWTEVADLNLARKAAAGAVASPSSNSLYFSGGSGPLPSWSATTEAWDNSSWTEVGDLNSARNGAGGAGSSNASAICISGEIPNNSQTVNVEEYNGSSWTEIANVNDARRYGVGLGTATAGLYVGGDNDPGYAATNELWNGSSWTEVGDMNTGRSQFGAGGTTTDGIVAGGRVPAKTSNTEHWDGSTWTEVANLAVARSDTNAGGGVSTSSLIAGGANATAFVASTEEFSAAGIADSLIDTGKVFYRSDTGDMKVTLNVLGTGAWASGGNTNHQDTERGGSAGTQTAGLIFGGGTPPAPIQATTEQYNGSTWTEVSALNTGRQALKGSVNSPYTSAIGFGGASSTTNPSGSNLNESWNGSSWTEIAELNTAAKNAGGCGTTTDALKISGQTAPGSALATVEKWNGNSWTEIAEVNSNRLEIMATGGSTSAIATGGSFIDGSPPNAALNNVEIWNGTSWTESTEINTARKNQHGCAGSSGSDALVYGGDIQPGVTANTELWNGSSWTELNNMATARSGIGGAGSSSTAFAARGTRPSATNATEEWTVPATVTNTTITD
jgi:hypothetical protein